MRTRTESIVCGQSLGSSPMLGCSNEVRRDDGVLLIRHRLVQNGIVENAILVKGLSFIFTSNFIRLYENHHTLNIKG